MIFIKVDADKKVYFRNYVPFDPIDGMGKTQTELEQEGYLVDAIPAPSIVDGSKDATLYYDGTNFYYEYTDSIPTEQELLAQLQESQKTPDEKYKELDLATAALVDVKQAKLDQLDYLCEQAINDGFDYALNGVSYRFSSSINAQSNFTGADALFKDGTITAAPWTAVNNATGAVERLTLDQSTFNAIKPLVFQHINGTISKFRDTLEPQVSSATTNAEVDAIVW